jgi:type IV secretion system protein VirD4
MAFGFGRRRPGIIGSGKPNGFYAGCFRDPVTNERGPEIWLPWLDPVLVVGRNRSGKDTGIIIPNALMCSTAVSLVFQDTRLEAAAIALPYRASIGPAYVSNPFNELVGPGYEDLRSDRVNLLKGRDLDPDNPLCFEHVLAQAAAIFPADGNHENPFFPLSSRALWCGLSKDELETAKAENRDPSMLRVRMAATEAEECDPQTGEPVKGLRARIRGIIDQGDDQKNSLLAAFAGKHSDGIRDVVATTAADTQWCLSKAIVEEEKAPGIDFSQLGEVPQTLFYGIKHDLATAFAPYMRLFVTALLQPLFAPHKVPVRIFLNEFAAMRRVPAVESALGLVAGSSIQLVIIVQTLSQLRDIYGESGWEVFFSQAGAVIVVGSVADDFSARYLSDHSGDLTIEQPNVGLSIGASGVGLSTGTGYYTRKNLLPQDLRKIPHGEGYIFIAGQNDPIPAIFPPYFADPVLSARARKNPFYKG